MQESPSQDLSEIWDAVREDLRQAVPSSAFETWLEPLRAVGVQGTRLYIEGPDRVREWFERRYGSLATAALRQRLPAVTEIVFSEKGVGAAQPAHDDGLPGALGPDLDFDRFVIGSGNRFAHAAALAVAELPGEAYNPLFLYGEPGLGKTHLLVSIARYLQRRRPDMTVLYTTAERFTAEFVSSVRSRDGAFRHRYRNLGTLLVDDVQFLEGKPKTEEELFHTFNELYSSGSQIVLSSDRPPEAMPALTERLRDRFAWGLTIEVKGPDLQTRIALLRRLAAERALVVPDVEVLRQIAVSVPANLRKLEGALTRVSAFASLLGESPSPEMVREALAPGRRSGELTDALPLADGAPTIEQIQQATCEVLHIARAELTSSRRAPALVHARQLAIYVSRRSTSSSLAEIARAFNRDHSTVLYAIRAVEKRLEPGSDVHRALEAIHERLHIQPEST